MNRIIIFLALFFCALSLSAQTYQEQLKAIHSNVVEEKDGKSFYVHTVKKGQTLYMISKSYGVEVNDIIAQNPAVKEGLKADQKLYIPMSPVAKEKQQTKTEPPKPENPKQESSKQEPPKPEPAKSKPEAVKAKTEITATPDSKAKPAVIPCGSDTTCRLRTYNVVLMLPLYLEEVSGFDPENAAPETLETLNSLKYLPFYEGFRLAVDSLQKQGLHLNLTVYDVCKDTAKTMQLLEKPELKSADLIIGLLFNKPFQIVAKFAHDNGIPIINPISERSEIIRNNEMVFKVNPSKNSMAECLAAFMQKNLNRGQIIIIRNGQFKDKDIAEKLKKECLERNLTVTLAEGQDVAIGKLSKSKENVIVAFTDNNAYALDLMRRFYELRNDYNISLIGLPEWEKIEGLETDFLNGLNTHIMSPSFTDYSDPGVKSLVRRFHEKYKSDPEPLAFQGFDLGYYFLSALMKFGKNFPNCIADFRLRTSQTSYEFVRAAPNSPHGFENRHWAVYKYESFKLIRLN